MGHNNTGFYNVKIQAQSYGEAIYGNGSVTWLPVFFFPPNHNNTLIMLQIKKIQDEWKFYLSKLTTAARHHGSATLTIYAGINSPHPQEQLTTDPCEYTTNIVENASRKSVLTIHNDYIKIMHHSRNDDNTMSLFTCTLHYTAQ